jgi:thiol-disulfide isomerase/thioredoxin
MTPAIVRRLQASRILTVAAAIAVLVAGGCGDSGASESALKAEQVTPAGIEQADPRLREIYEQADELLPGGANAYKQRIESLKGLPIVVNKWASWCPPCAAEFPYFQEQARKRGARIAFLGVNTNDAKDEAAAFLAKFPVPFPSYDDPRAEVAAAMRNVVSFPATGFYDASGDLRYVHQGQFATEAELAVAIDKYALGRSAPE